MDTLYKLWCVWYISSTNQLLNIEFIGKLSECVNFVEPRQYGCYAILPYESE